MITVHVGEQHHMNRAQARIVAAGHVVRGVIEKTHAGWILENDRAIVRAQFAGMRTDRRNFHVLGQGWQCGERKNNCCKCGLHSVPPRMHAVGILTPCAVSAHRFDSATALGFSVSNCLSCHWEYTSGITGLPRYAPKVAVECASGSFSASGTSMT